MSDLTKSRPGFGYSPALDGIRAFAVAAVVLFHAGVGGVAGGFLGVDTFFVLSGFLITSLLLADRSKITTFWVRRARRLLPALLAMLLATVVAGRFLLAGDPDATGLLRTDAFAALGYVANWRMIFRGTGYAAATATASPLQHTWSLGIEEQFYLLWPLLVVGLLTWLAARRARAALLFLCVAGAVLSQVLCAVLYRPEAIGRDYYGTDTRAQALLIGAALAVLTGRTLPRPGHPAESTTRPRSLPRLRLPAALVERPLRLGLPAALAAALTFWLWHAANDQAAWLYHGGLTVAALATAVIVAHVIAEPHAPIARTLSVPPLVGLGRISYGVYLWHWPLFCFVTADRTGLSRWPLLAVRLGGTLAVAIASYYVIEQPIRRGTLGRRLPRLVPTAVTAAALAAMVAVIAVIAVTTEPPPPATTLAAAPPVVIAPHLARRPAMAGRPGVPPAVRPGRITSPHEPRVTFLGDSVAWVIGSYLPAHPGLWTSVRAIQGCGIATLPDILETGTPHTNYPGCTSWPRRWQRGIDQDRPDVAVLELNRWELMDRRYQGHYQHVGEPGYDAYLTRQLDTAIDIAGSRGAAVVLLTAAYTHRAEQPDGSLYPEDQPQRVDAWNNLIRAAAARRPGEVSVLDIDPLVCPGGKFTWRIDGMRVRSDGLHYTPEAVQRIIAPWLLPKLAQIAESEPTG
ncbi:acyltransferase [Actinoplanes sp. KI2]|uniref:acyltransferase family protein n=1 Tax=Actinoplanes sp. KI2 TaxID=2983315 RepID=UPI0021D5E47E|nr:acyltransferase family protein [Actinoplanes sp. KI2]MCU7727984.1 acyltransferase [Actinoplanes sp. KI2]